jgi:hypothetical protein
MQTKRRPSKTRLKFELIWEFGKKPDFKMDGIPSLIFLIYGVFLLSSEAFFS